MIHDFRAMDLDERMLYTLAVGAVIGLILGFFMHREAHKREAVRGGTLAVVFHYLASSAISGLIPVIIVAIIGELPILRVIASGLTAALTTWLFLFLFAAVEQNAPPPEVVRELD